MSMCLSTLLKYSPLLLPRGESRPLIAGTKDCSVDGATYNSWIQGPLPSKSKGQSLHSRWFWTKAGLDLPGRVIFTPSNGLQNLHWVHRPQQRGTHPCDCKMVSYRIMLLLCTHFSFQCTTCYPVCFILNFKVNLIWERQWKILDRPFFKITIC